jgi:hypothetical protein
MVEEGRFGQGKGIGGERRIGEVCGKDGVVRNAGDWKGSLTAGRIIGGCGWNEVTLQGIKDR